MKPRLVLPNNWHTFSNIDKLSSQLANNILNIAERSIERGEKFNIVLTGGRSVLTLYTILSKSNSNWSNWHIYIGDERCLPKGHKDRNDRMINEIWLKNNFIPKNNIHFIKAELGVIEAIREYKTAIGKVDKFDVVLLSVGDDGHIASLFPNHSIPKDKDIVIINNSPKYPKRRISMSYKKLNNASNIFKILVGSSKQNVTKLMLNNKNLPVNNIGNNVDYIFAHVDAIPSIK